MERPRGKSSHRIEGYLRTDGMELTEPGVGERGSDECRLEEGRGEEQEREKEEVMMGHNWA